MAGNFVSDNCRLTTTALTTCYTAMGFPQVIGVRIVNYHVSATPRVSLSYFKATLGSSFFLHANVVLPVATALWIPYEGFGLYENDLIQAISDTANAIDVLVFIAEIPGRSQ